MEHKKMSKILKILSCMEYGLIFLVLFALVSYTFSGPIMLLFLYALGILSGYLGMTLPIQDLFMSLRNFFLRGEAQ